MSEVAGVLRVEGRPVGGQDVLALAGDAVVASALTDDLGRFSLGAPAGVTVIGKVRTGTYGVVAGVADAGGSVDLDLRGPLPKVDVTLESEHELPARIDLTLDPVRLAGVPDALMPFTRLRGPGVMEGHFARGVIDRAGARVRVQPGLWRIAATSIDPDRTHLRSLVTGRVLMDGAELEDFTLHVSADSRVTLVLRLATQTEL